MLSQQIKAKALELGFDHVGITKAVQPPHATFFLSWLDDGHAGEMEYLRRTAELRLDPIKLLANAKSAVVVGQNYLPREAAETTDRGRGVFAKYALGDDYHEVMREKLGALLSWLLGLVPEADGRVCIDTAPILERDFGQQAGIGWFGKNSCLINTRTGSFFFLGVLLLTVEMEYDSPAVGGCGDCHICLDACPTGALLEPFVLDANRCISYLTIEKRGTIEEEWRGRMGNHVFGCDICQSVCPFNRPRANAPERAKPTTETRFSPRPQTLAPKLADLLGLSREAYQSAFRHSAVKRATYSGLIRNACIAAGNGEDPSLLASLQQLEESEDEVIAEHAAWAVDRLRALTQR